MNINTVVNSSSFTVASTRPIQNNWGSEPDAWIHGYWSFDWADSFVKLQSAVPTSKPGITQLTSLASTPPVYGYLPKARFYGVNILAGECSKQQPRCVAHGGQHVGQRTSSCVSR